MRLIVGSLILLILSFIFLSYAFAGNKNYAPKTYEEAFNLAYDLVMTQPNEAIEVIKYINNQNILIKEKDIFFVNSLAALALRPIYREWEIGINLLEKVVSFKHNEFQSNYLLYGIYVSSLHWNPDKAKQYAVNLLDADYKSYINQTGIYFKKSSLPNIRNYKDDMVKVYQHMNTLFIECDEIERAKRANQIADDINKLK